MRFNPVVYMEWAKAGNRAAVNLARSGMAGLELSDLGLDLKALRINGEHPYGFRPLIEAIASRYGVDPECVVPTVGTSQAIFIACASLLKDGDAVFIEKPAYEPLRDVPGALGARIFRFERPFEDGFDVDPAAFRDRFPEGTKLVILTNLHNPSGVRLPSAKIRELASLAAERGAFVLIDEVYREFEAGPGPHTSFGQAENILVISSLTKAFGLSGLRCGWILAPRPLVPAIKRVVDHLHVEHVLLAEELSAGIFPLLDGFREKNLAGAAANKALVREFISGEPGLSWTEPDGGIVAFPRVAGGPGNEAPGDKLARDLRERYDTAIVPGSFFEDGRNFRLGFGLPEELLRRGLASIQAALRPRAPR